MYQQNQEDYLRAVYHIYEAGGQNANSVSVSRSLGVSKAAVSKMLKKLAAQKIIQMQPYSKITFTAKGLRQAKNLTFKHRIIEVFLTDVLKIEKNNIHKEAHNLEHAFSDKVIKKMANFLNNPKYCPSGKPIPKI